MAKILIDPGHGGNDPGASGCGLVEKAVTLSVSRKIKDNIAEMAKSYVDVFMSRTGDTNPSLTSRSNMANNYGVDVCISIHCNAFNGNAYGVETFTYGRGTNEMRLANCVHNRIINAGLYNANRGIKQENLHMVREPQMAAILVELAFIDNSSDAKLLSSQQDAFALEIAKGILDYLGIGYDSNTSSGSNSGSNSNSGSSSSVLYRVRKSWSDVSSQIGAYSDLDNAKRVCDQNPGYSVFNSSGSKVYPITVTGSGSCETVISEYWESGLCTITEPSGIYFRNEHCTHCGTIQGSYNYNESVYYDYVVITNKYVYISWIGASGARRYMPITDRSNGEKWAVCV